jgi:RNA polymerase sigma-B factor
MPTLTAPQPSTRRRDAERRLLLRYHHDGDVTARDELVRRLTPLARGLARRYAHLGEIEDLEQVACVGLLKAIDRFEPDRGTSFMSYAAPTIIGELKRHLRDCGWSVRVPRSLQEQALRVGAVMDRLQAEGHRNPTPREVAEEMGVPVEEVLHAAGAGAAYQALPLDTPARDGETPPADRLPCDEPGYEKVDATLSIGPALGKLTERERATLELRFGSELTQSQISERLGISQMQVSRVLASSLARLREAVH